MAAGRWARCRRADRSAGSMHAVRAPARRGPPPWVQPRPWQLFGGGCGRGLAGDGSGAAAGAFLRWFRRGGTGTGVGASAAGRSGTTGCEDDSVTLCSSVGAVAGGSASALRSSAGAAAGAGASRWCVGARRGSASAAGGGDAGGELIGRRPPAPMFLLPPAPMSQAATMAGKRYSQQRADQGGAHLAHASRRVWRARQPCRGSWRA